MAIDYDHLMNFDIPEVRQSYGAEEVARFGLTVGMGQDPMDLRQLPYVGALADDARAMPAIVNVLGHPGFWLGNPETGVDALKLVHGEQGITIHHPVPPEATIVGKTRVTGLVDKGEGRGALLYYEKEIRDAADQNASHIGPVAPCADPRQRARSWSARVAKDSAWPGQGAVPQTARQQQPPPGVFLSLR